MKKRENKKDIPWGKYGLFAFAGLIGVGFGLGIVGVLENSADTPAPDINIGFLLLMLLGLYVGFLFHVIVHEAGHLLFGLLSGYRFSSFRIFNHMWIKLDDRIRYKRLNIAGTAGQCLMIPPDPVNGNYPVFLYNLGGSLLNVIVSFFFLLLYILFADFSVLSTYLLMWGIIGLLLGLSNGIPLRLGMINNDGYNAFALSRDPEAMRSFWVQMKTLEQVVKGTRFKDLPAEWFRLPPDEAMKNSMTTVIGVFACSRLMDTHEFEEADRLMAHLLEIDSRMIDLHRHAMVGDRMYIEMISENRSEVLEEMMTKKQRSFMKQMKTSPSVIRNEFVWALLCENDPAKAASIKARFDKIAKSYPYESDIQSERELMKIAEENTR